MTEESLATVEAFVPARPAGLLRQLPYILLSMRPRQWTKNGIVFMALIFSVNQNWEPERVGSWDKLLLRSLLMAFVFCLVSGADYLVNDVRDQDNDRLHPRKRRRPIAAGLLA